MNPNYLGLIDKINYCVAQVQQLCCKVSQINSILGSVVATYTFVIGTDVPAGNTLASLLLVGTTIHNIVVDNGEVMIVDVPFDSTTGTLDFSSFGGLSNGSKVQITVTSA